MIKMMLTDLKVYVFLYIFLMSAHAVLLKTFTDPFDYHGQASESWHPGRLVNHDLFYMPYFQIYGELFLEKIQQDQRATQTWETYVYHCIVNINNELNQTFTVNY